jgi:hypothetical protein
MMFWLPIEGVAATFASHCAHQSNAGHELNASINLITDNNLQHNVDHKQPMDNHMASNQLCEVNTLCHASCSMLIAAEHSTNIPISDHSVHESLNTNTASFIPDLPQHPPRA